MYVISTTPGSGACAERDGAKSQRIDKIIAEARATLQALMIMDADSGRNVSASQGLDSLSIFAYVAGVIPERKIAWCAWLAFVAGIFFVAPAFGAEPDSSTNFQANLPTITVPRPAVPTIITPQPATVTPTLPAARSASSAPATPTAPQRIMPVNPPTAQDLLGNSLRRAPTATTPFPAAPETAQPIPSEQPIGTTNEAGYFQVPSTAPNLWEKPNPPGGVQYHW